MTHGVGTFVQIRACRSSLYVVCLDGLSASSRQGYLQATRSEGKKRSIPVTRLYVEHVHLSLKPDL